MHTTFAVTTEGLPLGLLDQNINSRLILDEDVKELKRRSHNIALLICCWLCPKNCVNFKIGYI